MPPRKRAEPPAGKHAASETNPRPGQWLAGGLIPPSTAPSMKTRRDTTPKHLAPVSAAPAGARKRTPVHAPTGSAPVAGRPPAAPTSSPVGGRSATVGVPKVRREPASAREVADALGQAADRAAYRQTHARPSTVGRAGAGAAAGAATGAALGSVVPGVGTGVGAAVGAGIGGVGGGVAGQRAKRAYRAALRTNGRFRQVLVAEFLVCLVIVGLSPLTERRRAEPPGAWMKRMTAVLGVFFLLGLMSAGGLVTLSAGLGGLVTAVLLVSERNVFTAITAAFGKPSQQPSGPGPGPGDVVGGAENPGAVTPIGETGVGGAENPGSVTPIGQAGPGIDVSSSWR